MNKVWRCALAVVLLATTAFSAGYGVALFRVEDSRAIAIREKDPRYDLIRPLLICQINEQIETKEFRPLEKSIEKIVDDAKRAGEVANASVYFRDLDSGVWIGVNEGDTYSPASLLKVPVMLSYLKKAEDDGKVLQQSYVYRRAANDVNPLIKVRLLEDGRVYSVDNLIRAMIVQSDNSAKDILTSHLDKSILGEAYLALGIASAYATSTDEQAYQISAKQYALFFRVLYNGTFLNREMSNKALQLLSESQFEMGLRAGTPPQVRVAHKYGIRANTSPLQGQAVELSDCGIVYSEKAPYLLCVMAEGDDPYVLADVIKRIAAEVYLEVVTNF